MVTVSQYFLLEIKRTHVCTRFQVCNCDKSFDTHDDLHYLGVQPLNTWLNSDLLSTCVL